MTRKRKKIISMCTCDFPSMATWSSRASWAAWATEASWASWSSCSSECSVTSWAFKASAPCRRSVVNSRNNTFF